MRLVSLRTIMLLFGGFALSLGAARANDYNVSFTDFGSGNSVVGSGTFSFNSNLGDGTYLLTSLPDYNIDFTVEGDTFTNADIDTVNLSNVEVVVYNGGDSFYFDTNCTEGPDCYGPYGGSLDFTDTNNSAFNLTTEPNYFGNPPLDLYEATGPDGSSFGAYTTTPEPESLWLLGTGLVGLFVRRFRRA